MPPSARGDGQRHLRRLRQLALDDLALDLEADQQEEHRHQPVVDPQQQRLGEAEPAIGEGELGLEQPVDRGASGELASTSASTAAASSGNADAASLSMKAFSRFVRHVMDPEKQNARVFRPGRLL